MDYNPTTCSTKTAAGNIDPKYVPCPYAVACTGFYFWNTAVNNNIGTKEAINLGYDKNVGHCMLVNEAYTDTDGNTNS